MKNSLLSRIRSELGSLKTHPEVQYLLLKKEIPSAFHHQHGIPYEPLLWQLLLPTWLLSQQPSCGTGDARPLDLHFVPGPLQTAR